MTLTRAQQEAKLKTSYNTAFGAGRDPSFGTKGGADYWIDTHNPQTDADWAEIDRMLQGSDEGVKYAASVAAGNPTVLPGGIDPTKSISSQSGPGTWASHFLDGGTFANENAAAAITDIANDIGFTPSEAYFNTGVIDNQTDDNNNNNNNDNNNNNNNNNYLTSDDLTAWWDALDKSAFTGNQQKSGGMDDFMKFMMFMSMMQPQRSGGGSQYGYGGLNPGGVQSAYNPMSNMASMMEMFKTLPGISTNTVNTGTTGGNSGN